MKFEELLILLPCHSLEDFPLHHTGAEAESLLACWSALWHPALVAAAGKTPSWKRVEDPPETFAERLVMVPSISEAQLPTGLAQRAKNEGGVLVRKPLKRDDAIAAALAQFDGGGAGLDAEFVADFLALGYCYLQVELLTRQMRYSSSLDQAYFERTAVAAAQAAAAGDMTLANEKLQAGFDVLAEERGRYYAVDAFLIDLTLVASTTLGQSLRSELQNTTPGNVLISGEMLAEMVAKEPNTVAAFREALAAGRAGLVGGEFSELRLSLLSAETVLANLQRGLATYEQHLGCRPLVYGRRRFGLTPLLPQVLERLGFKGAIHGSFDGGAVPQAAQAKIRWEGCGATAIDALARTARDANDAASYLNFCSKLGESMDADHVATMVLAHWPDQVSPWHDDVRRIARRGSALGKFVTLEEYFQNTSSPSQMETFTADQYTSQYLKEAIVREKPDVLSGPARYWKREALATCASAWHTLAASITNATAGERIKCSETQVEHDEQTGPAADDAEARAVAAAQASAEQFAAALPRGKSSVARGYLVANGHSFVRRTPVEVEQLSQLPPPGRPIYAVGESHSRKHAVVDVPPLGFLWLPEGQRSLSQARLPEPLAEEAVLRNEYFEVLLNRETGSLRAVHPYGKRGNRMSQQLAYRSGAGRRSDEADEAALYSVMAADSLEITANDHALGEITAQGRILDREGKTLAGYKQVYQLWRGSRVLFLEIELDVREEPKADPWNSYYACRFAWSDETAELLRAVNQVQQPATTRRLECPLYFEIAGGQERTCILTGGLPFHRRIGLRMLDTLLVTRGESGRKFRLGIGLDVPYPLQEGLALLAPPVALGERAAPPAPNSSSWLFHLDAKNVVATHWQPLCENGKTAGFRVRLLETAGRPANLAVSAFRTIQTAQRLNFLGAPLGDCVVDQGKARLELAAGEFAELEARW